MALPCWLCASPGTRPSGKGNLAFAHHTFQPITCGCLEQRRTIIEGFDQIQATDCSAVHQMRQQSLSLDEGEIAGTLPVKMQQIEGEIEQLKLCRGPHGGLQAMNTFGIR